MIQTLLPHLIIFTHWNREDWIKKTLTTDFYFDFYELCSFSRGNYFYELGYNGRWTELHQQQHCFWTSNWGKCHATKAAAIWIWYCLFNSRGDWILWVTDVLDMSYSVRLRKRDELDPFETLVGGLSWCIGYIKPDFNRDIVYTEGMSLGKKIAISEKIIVCLQQYFVCFEMWG